MQFTYLKSIQHEFAMTFNEPAVRNPWILKLNATFLKDSILKNTINNWEIWYIIHCEIDSFESYGLDNQNQLPTKIYRSQ
ncbi:hypothetical protein V6Z12_A10G135300 [Gossypium hirsutum]